MKLPLASSLKNRASSLAEDAKLLNGYVETLGDPKKGGLVYAEKRPAMDSAFELTAGTGQGLYVPNTPDGDGEPGVIIGDILTRAPNPKKKRLAFGVQPSGVVLNTAISPAITVRILDSIGNLASGATDAVTIALSSNPTGATLGGTLTRNAVAGVATFNDITLDRSGENFTIIATASGLNSATSNAFTLATSLAFTTQPSSTTANTDFTVAVTSRDTAGNTDTNYTGTVTLSLWSATGNGIPTGDFIVDAVAGVATFANISLSDSGISGNADGTYQFVARADQESFVDYYIPAAAVSNSFNISDSFSLVATTHTGGERVGFDSGGNYPGSSISPSILEGKTISELSSTTPAIDAQTVFGVTDGSVAQSFFTSITIGATTLLSADAIYGAGVWTWNGTRLVTSATTFTVTFVIP